MSLTISTALTGSCGCTAGAPEGVLLQSVVTTVVSLNTTEVFGLTCVRFGWMLPAAAQRVVQGAEQKLARATAFSVTSPPATTFTSELPPNRPPKPATKSVGAVALA